MITEDTLKTLLGRRTEFKNLDYKGLMNWATASNEEKCELVKDILAMMNTQDGGQIIIGVEDKTYDPIGLTEADFESFDPTKVNDFVRKFTDSLASCQVQKLTLDGKKFIVIDVLEFTDVPIICKAGANSSENKLILKRGGVYIRTDKPSSELVSSAEEMRELMGLAGADPGFWGSAIFRRDTLAPRVRCGHALRRHAVLPAHLPPGSKEQ